MLQGSTLHSYKAMPPSKLLDVIANVSPAIYGGFPVRRLTELAERKRRGLVRGLIP